MIKKISSLAIVFCLTANAQNLFPYCPQPPEKIESGKLCIPKPQELPICPVAGDKGTCFEAGMFKNGLVYVRKYENNENTFSKYIRAFYKGPNTSNDLSKFHSPTISARGKSSESVDLKKSKNPEDGIGVLCPNQVPPSMPAKAIRDNIQGTIKAEVLVKDGKVDEVSILSGPRVFHMAVVEAMFEYECLKEPNVRLTTQEFAFIIE